MDDIVRMTVEQLCKEVFKINPEDIYSKRVPKKLNRLKDCKHITIFMLHKYKLIKNQKESALIFNYNNRSMISILLNKINNIKDDWFESKLSEANRVMVKIMRGMDFKGPIRREYHITVYDQFSEMYKFQLLSIMSSDKSQEIRYNGLIFILEKFEHEGTIYISIKKLN